MQPILLEPVFIVSLGSKYTYSLKGANIKAKANVVQGIPELLRNAKGKYFRKNTADKHKKNAANRWYRYDSYFALPVQGINDKEITYNVFHASLLVRHAKDGKFYLYDVIDIKKETSTPFES